MKKHLISNEGTFYKANLHCHTTLTDGKFSPEEIKKFYKDMGYSVVAYTDHDVFIPHNDLTDDSFLALNGFEMEFVDRYECYENLTPWDSLKHCHICSIAPNPEIELQPFYPRDLYLCGNRESKKLAKFAPDDPTNDFERWYDKKCINYVIKTMRERGYFVTYNHPTWSMEDYSNYSKYKGMHAMEMFNGSLAYGYQDYNPTVYDDILRTGNKIYCIGADDNHRDIDMGVCWTMIKAQKLEYKAIIDSLFSGNFYCSEGPEINELYIEDGVLNIKCSNAQIIKVNYEARKAQIKLIEDNKPLTQASFELSKDHGYFRVTVVGLDGKKACTNAYFLDDLGL